MTTEGKCMPSSGICNIRGAETDFLHTSNNHRESPGYSSCGASSRNRYMAYIFHYFLDTPHQWFLGSLGRISESLNRAVRRLVARDIH